MSGSNPVSNSSASISHASGTKAVSKHTPLHDQHVQCGGKLVDFAGWHLPVNYGSQIEEHHSVRQRAGMFDVSHMTLIDITGDDATDALRELLANDVARLTPPLADGVGRALYSCMLNSAGGVIDDLIVYHLSDTHYRLIVNAATREKDLQWMNSTIGDRVTITEVSHHALIAVQGPEAVKLAGECLKPSVAQLASRLKRFSACVADDWFIARTGYTGEDGFEIALPAADAPGLWQALHGAGVAPCGLGARDTLRLESGMNLYGSDMDESVTPLECGLEWTIDWRDDQRRFVGRDALEQQLLAGDYATMHGLVLEARGVLRGGQAVTINDVPVGTITSGTFSPTLQKSIAFARLQPNATDRCDVVIRDKPLAARRIRLPFVKGGMATFA